MTATESHAAFSEIGKMARANAEKRLELLRGVSEAMGAALDALPRGLVFIEPDGSFRLPTKRDI